MTTGCLQPTQAPSQQLRTPCWISGKQHGTSAKAKAADDVTCSRRGVPFRRGGIPVTALMTLGRGATEMGLGLYINYFCWFY